MAQRRVRKRTLRRVAYRLGMAGARASLGALLALAGLAGIAGMVWQTQNQGVVIVRGAEEGLTGAEEAEDGGGDTQGEATEDSDAGREGVRCLVHVDGAVGAPGVVELSGPDLRVMDAVTAAGGLLEDADTSMVNLAEPLADGAKIHIPHEGERDGAQEGLPSAGQAQTLGATGSGDAVALVNINTATSEELQTLSGVGEATARAIIDERERNGPYASIEDLMRVSGIGEKRFSKLRDRICV